MKTQILQLEPHDDIISTRDRMSWGQTNRIVLVWPAGVRILNRRLDLVLLQRQSADLGAQLALVTRDPEVRFHAHELRIPVFQTLKDAQRARWRTSRRRRLRIRRRPRPDFRNLSESLAQSAPKLRDPKWTGHPAARLGFFSLALLSILALLSFFLPSAAIKLHPETVLQETSLVVTADTAAGSVTLGGLLPATPISVVVEGRDTIPVTGRVRVPESYASGFARFTNLTTEHIDIPKGQIILTNKPGAPDQIRFQTTNSGKVPAGNGESIVLPVRALSPGSQGNLRPLSLVAVEGPLGLKVSVTNHVETDGGSDRLFPAPSAKDYTLLSDQLVATLEKTALDELRENAAPGDYLIEPSITISEVLEETFFPSQTEDGGVSPAEELSLTLRVEFQVQVVSGRDLESLAGRLLDAGLPDEVEPVPETLEIVHLTQPVMDADGVYLWRVAAKRILGRKIDLEDAALLAAGLPPEKAIEAFMERLPLSRPPEIQLAPAWWPRLPFFTYRIEIDSTP